MAKDKARIRAVFFDLDDTLCAYWDASKTALRKTFERHAPEGHDADEMMRNWAATFRDFSKSIKQSGWYEGYCVSGEPTRTEQMRLTLRNMGIEEDALAAQLSETYRRERNSALVLFPEAEQVLKTLSRQFPLGLITNGPADIQREEIATLGIAKYLAHIFIEGEMKEGKPLPAVFRRAEAAVRCSGDQILFVGNSYAHDVRPALEAGWHAIWVRRESDVPPSFDGSLAKPEQRPEGAPEPDAIVNDLRDVLKWLESATPAASNAR